ncbi:MAG: HepT-like ribonuclease domain-containing protein [Acidobacteriaceae bacterium]
MRRDLSAYLWDVKRACDDIESFLAGRSFEDYQTDRMLQAAVERKFEIIGEALNQASRHFPNLPGKLQDIEQAIAFRNKLIHGYEHVSATVVWSAATSHLRILREQVASLLEYLGDVLESKR